MDIFDITKRQNSTPSQNSKFAQRSGVIGVEYGISAPVFDETKNNPAKYAYREPIKCCDKKGKHKQILALKFYNYLYNNPTRECIDAQKRDKTIQKFLKKGINFDYFTEDMKIKLIHELSPIEILLIHENGCDMERALYNEYASTLIAESCCCIKKIWHKSQLERIPNDVLEGIINTRKKISISYLTVNDIIGGVRAGNKLRIEMVETLIKYGQVWLNENHVRFLMVNIEAPYIKAHAPTMYELVKYAYSQFKHQDVEIVEENKHQAKIDADLEIKRLFENAQDLVKQGVEYGHF